ncbi:DUF512 domain-containing protein [Adlercreutzia equolifaciens]|uniref:DUF512 domain-containing protein n=1 Tax=Adlercreutzia equolifaciens TaxID=446660 RepID=UPI0023B1617E|nr:DUF512 domain-containing protein [Adlercreutzia equolifaciens]MDE8702970.1 DUF512 domain-containing protein [Adlercreutzia equolifaciens]
MAVYPGKEIERDAACAACAVAPVDAAVAAWDGPAARIAAVDAESPADDAGFEPGCYLTSVDGAPLRDIIDWRWLSADDVITVGYIDLDGEAGEVELERYPGEDWGFTFDGVLFDRVKLCRNACIFCFMRQLPDDARASLSLRDDDFRLSFLSGTFVTLTNLKSEDEARIIEQHISPLRVSLHASNPDLRRRMIGRHAQHGLDALDRLLDAGIQAHAQIVLMPGINDGDALRETLEWAWERPGLSGVGIVPLGFTKHQTELHESFTTPEAARGVIEVIRPFQERARAERGTPWVFAADEFYVNAFGVDTPEHIPPASDYGDYEMFEDGIGIVRSYVDEFNEAVASGLAASTAEALKTAGLAARYIIGEAMQPFLDAMIAKSPLAGHLIPLTVKNDYFGGNVNVTGLLCACDIEKAIKEEQAAKISTTAESGGDTGCPDRASSAATETAQWAVSPSEDCLSESGYPVAPPPGEPQLFLLPRVILNDNGVTLDDATVQDMETETATRIHVVSCNPLDFLPEIIALAAPPAL